MAVSEFMCCLKPGRDVDAIGQRDEAEKIMKVATADSRHTGRGGGVEVAGRHWGSRYSLVQHPCR